MSRRKWHLRSGNPRPRMSHDRLWPSCRISSYIKCDKIDRSYVPQRATTLEPRGAVLRPTATPRRARRAVRSRVTSSPHPARGIRLRPRYATHLGTARRAVSRGVPQVACGMYVRSLSFMRWRAFAPLLRPPQSLPAHRRTQVAARARRAAPAAAPSAPTVRSRRCRRQSRRAAAAQAQE